MGGLLRDRPVVRGLVRGLAIVVIVVGVAYLGLWGVWQVWGPGWLADETAGAVAAQPVTPVPQEQYQAGYAAGCEVGKSDAAYGNDAGRSAWMVDGEGRLGGPTPEAYDDGWQEGYRDGRNDIWSRHPEGCLP